MVERQANLLSQQRIDIPHLRGMESSVAADFDLLAGKIVGGNKALVIYGFNLVTTGAIGAAATSLQLITANGILVHPLATESGSIFKVLADRATETLNSSNTRLEGSFTPNQVNYVGVDLRRSADDSTADVVQFLDPDLNTENARTVQLARTLDYVIVVSTQDFSFTPGIAPLAKVTTNSSNIVTAIVDARNLMFRLGSGGSVPNVQYAYPWPGSRFENTSGDVFAGGDKAIDSMKSWFDAVMTRLWEIGGGKNWYSPTADRNVTMVRSGTTFTNGEYFEWDGTHLHWRGLKFIFDNSGGSVNVNEVNDRLTDSSGLTNLADGECVYVDLDRTINRTVGLGNALTAVKAVYATLGAPLVPGSRYVIAWRYGTTVFTRNSYFSVGTAFQVATPSALGVVKLNATAGAPSAPVVPSLDGSNFIQGIGLYRSSAIGTGTLFLGGGNAANSVQIGDTASGGTAPSSSGLDSISSVIDLVGLGTNNGLVAVYDNNGNHSIYRHLMRWATGAAGTSDEPKEVARIDNKGVFRSEYLKTTNELIVPYDMPTTLGGFTDVRKNGSFGGSPAVTPSGVSAGSYIYFVKITLGGTLGVAKFQLSRDGGRTYEAEQTTAATYTHSSGLIITFAAGTYVLNDIYYFRPRGGPQFAAHNSAGVVKSTIDRLGYRCDRINDISENWNFIYTSNHASGRYTDHGAITIVKSALGGNGGTLVMNSPCYFFNITSNGSAINQTNSVHTTTKITNLFADVESSFEWDAYVDNSAQDFNDVYMGLWSNQDYPVPGASFDGAYFVRLQGEAVWKYVTTRNNVTTGPTTTGVTFASGTKYRFRIELLGSSTPEGAAVQFWINEVMVARSTTNLPDTEGMYAGWAFRSPINGTNTWTNTCFISPWKFSGNRWEMTETV
jgi:hypothetical protein